MKNGPKRKRGQVANKPASTVRAAGSARLQQITAAPYNPRKISPEALAGLKASLATFGDLSGFVINRRTGHIVCGHQRREALAGEDFGAVQWSAERTVEVGPPGKRFRAGECRGTIEIDGKIFGVRLVDWPMEFEKAANVAANATTIQGTFTEKLDELLLEIKREYPQLSDELLLAELLVGDEPVLDGLTDPDAIPVVGPEDAVCGPGDLWELGEHRMICGDCADETLMNRLTSGSPADLVNTDPPYGIAVHTSVERGNLLGEKRRSRGHDRPLRNDAAKPEDYRKLLDRWMPAVERSLRPGRSFYLWASDKNLGNYPPAIERAGLKWQQVIVWTKGAPVLTRCDYMRDHEICFYGWKPGAAHRFFKKGASDVWPVKRDKAAELVHLTQKPVELAVRAIYCSSLEGETVLDLFGGSGSTLIAAEQTGRVARVVEIDPVHCDTIIKRWEQFTGRKAKKL